MAVFDAEAILALDDLIVEEVRIPQWDTTVRVRSLTGRQRDSFEEHSITRRGRDFDANLKDIRARLVALSVINGDGSRAWSDDQVEKLSGKNAAALDLIFTVARRLSGLSTADLEELAKNSVPGPSAGSPSD